MVTPGRGTTQARTSTEPSTRRAVSHSGHDPSRWAGRPVWPDPWGGGRWGALLSAYILYEAIRLGAPKTVLLRMVTNIGIDTVVGAVPVVGDIFDIAWKANKKNAILLHAYLASQRTA